MTYYELIAEEDVKFDRNELIAALYEAAERLKLYDDANIQFSEHHTVSVNFTDKTLVLNYN